MNQATTPADVGWGKYSKWEGPWYKGSLPLEIPNPTSYAEKVMLVFGASEGARWNAINMYDRMVMSVGAFQWADGGIFAVTDLLGAVRLADPKALEELAPAMAASKATFELLPGSKWRFKFPGTGWIDTIEEQRKLYLLNSSGLIGDWDEESKAHAKLWAACMANVFTHPGAIKAQAEFTAARFMWFVTKEAKPILWGPSTPQGDSSNVGWVGAIRTAYLSYAGNLPAVASAQLLAHVAETKDPIFSEAWCIGLLKRLTFGPQIAVFPVRYNKIRPVLEKLFAVNLPDMATELQAWKQTVLTPPTVPVPPGLTLADFDTVEEYQRELIAEGYDLGPAGADGVMGTKTKEAVFAFQGKHGLKADGVIGPKTRQAFLAVALARG